MCKSFSISVFCRKLKICWRNIYNDTNVHSAKFSFDSPTSHTHKSYMDSEKKSCPRKYFYTVMDEKCIEYEKLFINLENFNYGDRLNIYDNKLEISSPSVYQSIERWYHTQSRKETLYALSKLLKDYFYFCGEVIGCCKDRQDYYCSCIIYPNDFTTLQKTIFDIPVRIHTINNILKNITKKLWKLYEDNGDDEIVIGYVQLLNKIIRIDIRLCDFLKT